MALCLEYEDVLLREPLVLPEPSIQAVLDQLANISVHPEMHFLWRPQLRDPKDDHVLELAINGQCPYIVTFNVRDFRGSDAFGVQAITPAEFLGPAWRFTMSALSVRLPDSLHRYLKEVARKEGVSVNTLISTAVAEKVSALMTEDYLKARAAREAGTPSTPPWPSSPTPNPPPKTACPSPTSQIPQPHASQVRACLS